MRPLRRNRLLLIASLAFLGATLGVTFNLLKPDGLIASSQRWPSADVREVVGVEGYGADRFGAPCGVRGVLDGEVRDVPLPECTSYQPPAVRWVDGERVVIWELADTEVAIGTLDEQLEIEAMRTVARPRASYGALLPRTDVAVDHDRLAVFYDDVLTVHLDGHLQVWPGGAPQVAAARLGPRGPVLVSGVIALFLLTVLGAGWTLTLPWRLTRLRRAGRTLEVKLSEHGTSVLVGGQPLELDLSRAATMGASIADLGGRAVTLVLDRGVLREGGYRALERARVLQLWPGDYRRAYLRARAMRTGAVAAAVAALALLLLGLDAYVTL